MKSLPMIPAYDADLEATTHSARTTAEPRGDETGSKAALTSIECPLHTAMRQVAEAALTQHVLYTEGVYRPRDGLLREMQVWLRVHELVRTAICPATRTTGILEPGDLEIAVAGLPVEMRARVATAIRVCARCSAGESCPLESEPEESLLR